MPRVKFQAGNSGRPKGAKNRNTTLIRESFAKVFSDLQLDPRRSLLAWAQKDSRNLTEFYKLAAKLIPIQIAGDETNPLKGELKIIHITTTTPVAESEEEVS